MTTLEIILAASGAVICFVWAFWLKIRPAPHDGCIYKPPGFWRNETRSAKAATNTAIGLTDEVRKAHNKLLDNEWNARIST